MVDDSIDLLITANFVFNANIFKQNSQTRK